jgi:hyperosmotically inducible periplasmic protein
MIHLTFKFNIMKYTKVLSILALAGTLTFTACKPSDADLKSKIEAAFKADPSMASTMVEVKDGVATIMGTCSDEACRAKCEAAAAGIKGVKSVVNNCEVPPPPPVVAAPASISTMLDAATQQKVKDGIKDLAGVAVEFAGDKAVFSGAITKADRMKLMQMLASAKVKSDVTKLTNK